MSFQDMVQTLRQRFDGARLTQARLSGQRESSQRRATELTHSVGMAKGRLALGDELKRAFHTLQERAHERSVGAFERLLTAIARDVLELDGRIKLDLSIIGSAPSLDISVERPSGHLEDVLEGNGGALTNVISTGTRYAALSRTDNRPFMVLDEPDCWLKPERIPAFVKVVSEVSSSIGVQTFFISHHSPKYFEGKINVVELAKDADGLIRATPVQPLCFDWANDDEAGLRAIELINIRTHKHTVIPCFPGATAFIGDNNVGKSTAIVSAVKAMAYGKSDDSLIRHDEDEGRIIFHLENNRRIEWSRKIKRNPIVQWCMYDGETLVKPWTAAPKVNQAPAWVVQELRITPVDNLDIQIGSQKSPVFLLGETSSKRAQLLSVGRESGHLTAAMQRYDELKRADRDTERTGEAELRRLNWVLDCAKVLDETAPALEKVQPSLVALEKVAEGSSRLVSLHSRLTSAGQVMMQSEGVVSALTHLPDVPTLADTSRLSSAVTRLGLAQRRALAPVDWLECSAPELAAVDNLRDLGVRISQSAKRAQLADMLPATLPEPPELTDLKALSKAGEVLKNAQTALSASESELIALDNELRATELSVQQLKDALGGECPACGAILEEEGSHAHSH